MLIRRGLVVGVLACTAAIGAACSLTTDLNGLSGMQYRIITPDADTESGASSSGNSPTDAASAADVGITQVAPVQGWRFRKPLTVDKTNVEGTSDLIGFPLLVSMNDGDLKTVESGGKIVSGLDIAFFAADGVTQLAHEIEQYSPSTGQLLAWVRVPALSPTATTKLYMRFGNPEVKTPLENRAAVWSDGYAGVWHMSDSTWIDSVSTGKGAPFGGATTSQAGKIGTGGVFGATDVFVDVGSNPNILPTSITISAWAKPASVGSAPDRHPYMVRQDSWRAAGSDPRGYYMEIYRTQTNPRPTFYTGNGTTIAHAFATTPVVNGTWYNVVGTRDEVSGVTRIYVNGIEEGTATMAGGIAYITTNTVHLGGISTETWDGELDEVRISRVARSAEWIHAEYDNQQSPQTFVTVGAIEAISSSQ